MKNLYEILGIEDILCSQSEIKAKFHEKILETHPDKIQLEKNNSIEAISNVYEAWKILGSEESRRNYDKVLKNELAHRNRFENCYCETVSLKEEAQYDDITKIYTFLCVQCGETIQLHIEEYKEDKRIMKECISCNIKVLIIA